MNIGKFKKRFLTTFLAVAMVFTSVNLTPFGTATVHAAESTALKAGDYYIQNTATGRFLNGGNSWGTQASALAYGQLMTVNAVNIVSPEEGIGIYTIDSHFGSGSKHFVHAGAQNDGFVDQDATDLTITKCENGNFTILGDGRYLTASNDNTVAAFVSEKSEYSEWRFVSREDYIAEAVDNVKKGTAADVTSLILDSGFARNNQYESAWNYANKDGWSKVPGGSSTNYMIEYYKNDATGNIDCKQTIANVPNGVYELSMQGFCRRSGDYEIPKVFINETEQNIKLIEDEAKNSATGGWAFDSNGKFVPNNVTQTLECFAANGYVNGPVRVTVCDHTLTVGLKAQNIKAQDWIAWDNFTLKLVDVDAGDVLAKIKAIGEVELTSICKTKIDDARASYNALTETQQGYISEAQLKILTDAEAKYDELFEAAGGQEAVDQAFADNVIAKINAIEEVALTAESKAKIDDARAAYDALTDGQKAKITAEQYKVLTDAEAAYKNLKDAADKKAADAVVAKITAIGEVSFTLESRLAIKAARTSYDLLTDAQKALVTEAQYKVLTDAEAKYTQLSAVPVLAAGDYYVVNATTGMYLNSGNDWGTRASIKTYGQLVKVEYNQNSKTYTIDTQYKNTEAKHYLGSDGYMDAEIAQLKIEKCADGNLSIANASDSFLTAPVQGGTTVVTFESNVSEGSKWLFLTRQQLIDKLKDEATEENPAYATSLILDSGFSRHNAYFSEWKVEGTKDGEYKKGGYDSAANECNHCVQFYHTATDVYQEITGIPNGLYQLSVQGFYSAAADAVPAVYYANEVEKTLMSIEDDARDEKTGGWTTDKNGKFVPNGVEDCSRCFNAGGYTNDFINVTVTENKLRVGVKATDTKNWVAWDNFTLKLIVADEKKAADAVAKITAIGDVSLESKADIEAARAAYNALSENQKKLITAEQLKLLTDAEAEYDRLVEEAGPEAANMAAAAAVVKKINAIGQVAFTPESKAKIDEARAAYNALKPEESKYVTAEQLKVLTDAETRYEELQTAENQAVADQVIAKITALKGEFTYTLDRRIAIVKARAAYDALTEVQQGLVTNYEELTAAEAEEAELADAVLGDYYIVNTATGRFLNGGNNWATQASALNYGQLMTLNVVNAEKDMYNIDSHISNGGNNHYVSADGYLDGSVASLTITKCENGSFTIGAGGNYLTAGTDSTIVAYEDEKSDLSEWRFLTREELIKDAVDNVTDDASVDVTSLIQDSSFSRNNQYFDAWTGSEITKAGDNANNGENKDFYAEKKNAAFDSYQEVANVPNGVYELSVQGFYSAGADATPAVYYINGVEGALKKIEDEGKAEATGGWTTQKEGGNVYLPSTASDVAKCFSAGAYVNDAIMVTVTNNKLKVGVKTTDANSWVAWDNFTLKLKKILTDADIAADVVTKIEAIGDVAATEESKDKIDAAREAYEALTDAQKALVPAAKLEELEAKEDLYTDLTADPADIEKLKGELTEAVQEAQAEALVQEAYTKDSWKAYDDALKALQTLAQKPDAKKSEMERALKAFKEANTGLEVKDNYKPTDPQNQTLAATITDAGNIKAGDYKEDENWTAFQKAFARAQEIKNRPNATGAQVQKAMDDLKAAIDKLTPAKEDEKVDKTALNNAIRNYGSLKASDYTASTWNAFKTALDAAKKISAKADATQAEVNAALATLNAKKQALRKPIKVSKIKITADYTKVAAGKKATLKAKITPSNAANKGVTWSIDKTSKSKKYASISSKGVLTTNKKGAGKTVTVTATAKDGSGKKSTIKIKVMKGGVKKISLKAKTKKVKVGKKLSLKATVSVTSKKKSQANTKLTWKTSNKKVATVDSKGRVTGKKAGKVTITATSTDGTKKSGKIKLTVVKK